MSAAPALAVNLGAVAIAVPTDSGIRAAVPLPPLAASAPASRCQWVFNVYIRHGSRTPFGGRHLSSRRSPLSDRGMRLGNRHRRPRSS